MTIDIHFMGYELTGALRQQQPDVKAMHTLLNG